MKLIVDELKQLFQLTLRYFCEKKVQRITFRGKEAYYPKFWREDIKFNDPEFMKCPHFTIGSLDDDIEDVKYVLAKKIWFLFVAHGKTWSYSRHCWCLGRGWG